MSQSHVDELNEVRIVYRNQPLVMLEVNGELRIVPIGCRITLTSAGTMTVRGVINADDSATVVP